MIILLIILLIFSAYFSGSETALFHLKSMNNVNEDVKKLLLRPKKLLSTLITGNTIVNIAIGSLAATYTVNNLSQISSLSISTLLFAEVVVITSLVLIFGEIIPKTYAIHKSENLANVSAIKVFPVPVGPMTRILLLSNSTSSSEWSDKIRL